MAETIDSVEERQMVSAVKQAVELVDAGATPDDAIEKIARASGFGPGRIQLIASAYNTGKQLGQWQNGGSILDKLASYPLANGQGVVDRIYTTTSKSEKAAVDVVVVGEEYQRPPTWLPKPPMEKAASALAQFAVAAPEPYAPDPMFALQKARGQIERDKRACEELRREVYAAKETTRANVARLSTYFRKAAYDRLPFATVESAALTYMDPMAAPLMNLVYEAANLGPRREKRAGDRDTLETSVDLQAAPFGLIRATIKAAYDHARLQKLLSEKQAEAAERKEASMRPFSRAQQEEPPDPVWDEKAAGLFSTPAFGAFAGAALSRGMGGVPKTKDELVEDEWMKLEDPAHANELRKIKAQAMLNSLMTDPDNSISGHDPDKILKTYNEIAQAAPRVAENSATLSPVLRRRLESHTEPFEAKELIETEKALAQSRMPTPNSSLLSEAPDSLLG